MSAAIRGSNQRGIPATLVHRGDEARGTILLKIDRRDQGHELWTQVRNSHGEPAWLRVQRNNILTSLDAHDYALRAIARDPDLWVLEVEDPAGVNPFDGAIAG